MGSSAGEQEAPFRYFDLIMALFVAVLLISNIASTKILTLWKFTFDGGTILFPLSYIFGDILTEVYGYRRARKVIWTGFFAALMMSLILWVVQLLPPADGWPNQKSYEEVIGFIPRIVAASLVAYFTGEFTNSWLLSRLKVKTGGKYLWLRTIGSTLVGQAVDTGLFVVVAFAGVLSPELLASVVASNYAFKVAFEAAATPVTYRVVAYLKRAERVDHFDLDTNFSPFVLGVR